MQERDTRSSTGVPPVNHGRDGQATTNGIAAFHIRQEARLSHWTGEGATQVVAFCLGDPLPRAVLDAWILERENMVKTGAQLGRPLIADEERVDAWKCWLREDAEI